MISTSRSSRSTSAISASSSDAEACTTPPLPTATHFRPTHQGSECESCSSMYRHPYSEGHPQNRENCVMDKVFPSRSANHPTRADEGDCQTPRSSWSRPGKHQTETPPSLAQRAHRSVYAFYQPPEHRYVDQSEPLKGVSRSRIGPVCTTKANGYSSMRISPRCST